MKSDVHDCLLQGMKVTNVLVQAILVANSLQYPSSCVRSNALLPSFCAIAFVSRAQFAPVQRYCFVAAAVIGMAMKLFGRAVWKGALRFPRVNALLLSPYSAPMTFTYFRPQPVAHRTEGKVRLSRFRDETPGLNNLLACLVFSYV